MKMYGLKLMMMSRLKCDHYCRSYTHIVCRQFQRIQLTHIRSYVARRIVNRPVTMLTNDAQTDDGSFWPRKIFSGIQPTGALHLGNYLGAVRKWTQLQEARDDVTYCIVDMHSITLPQDPVALRENIFKLAATMLACGIDPNRSTIFVQSAVKEHTELCWLLGTLCTMARLGHLPQYKDKTRQLKEIPLGLFVYPILQAADIMLYKTTHVPVGEDQVQHIQLTQHLAKIFNSRFGRTFPICHAIIEEKEVSRIRSLRDPSKKMSKSDPDPKSAIYITDPPDIVVEKVKKAITDFCSDVSFDPEGRPGVSNLVAIHSHMSGQPIEKIINEARTLDTGKYKLRVAEAINEHLKPIREKIEEHLEDRNELINILEIGAEKARNIAFDTVEEVKHKMGLGAPYVPLYLDTIRPTNGNMEEEQMRPCGGGSAGGAAQVSASATATATAVAATAPPVSTHTSMMMMTSIPQTSTITNATLSGPATAASKQGKSHMLEAKLATLEVSRKLSAVLKPTVPQQRLRVEKNRDQRKTISPAKPVNIVSDITKGLLNKGLLRKRMSSTTKSSGADNTALDTTERKVRRIAGCVDSNAQPTMLTTTPISTTSTITAPVVSGQANKCETSNSSHTCKVVEKMLMTTTIPTTAPTTMPVSKSNTLTLPNTPSSAEPSLPVSKTTSPATWNESKSKNSNGEVSGKSSKSDKKNSRKNKIIATTTTLETPKTFKRHITTSTVITNAKDKNSDGPKNDGSSRKLTLNRKIVERTLIFGVLAIGAGFGGVYYFWRSIFKAYFDSKKNDGG